MAALLDEAKDRCKATIKTRREERNEPISEEELESSSAIMGYAAVKYADLKNNRKTDYRSAIPCSWVAWPLQIFPPAL